MSTYQEDAYDEFYADEHGTGEVELEEDVDDQDYDYTEWNDV